MSIINRQDSEASSLAFARRDANRTTWRRAIAFLKSTYPALIVYTLLCVGLVAAIAIRVSIWMQPYWH